MTQEAHRLQAAQERTAHWRRWGPYLSERQWGTVREDYSPDGTAWDFFRTTKRAPGLIAGARMAWLGFLTTINGCALRWPCGTARTPFSKNGSSASPATRAITGKM
jgi:hypothetical protein